MFELEVGAGDFAAVDGEAAGERGRGGEQVARLELAFADGGFELGADLEVDGGLGAGLELDVYHLSSSLSTYWEPKELNRVRLSGSTTVRSSWFRYIKLVSPDVY